jgi:protein dithiol:quinone oxidoreductase
MRTLVEHRRPVSAIAGLACFALVGYALYLQTAQGLDPCPLCIFQRVGFIVLGAVLLLAALPPARLRWALMLASVAIGLVAIASAGVSVRHVYIQSLPPGAVPACGATLDYLREIFPLTEVVRKVLTGSGECQKIDWTFMGLAMPAWALIWTVILGLVGVVANWPRRIASGVRVAR